MARAFARLRANDHCVAGLSFAARPRDPRQATAGPEHYVVEDGGSSLRGPRRLAGPRHAESRRITD